MGASKSLTLPDLKSYENDVLEFFKSKDMKNIQVGDIVTPVDGARFGQARFVSTGPNPGVYKYLFQYGSNVETSFLAGSGVKDAIPQCKETIGLSAGTARGFGGLRSWHSGSRYTPVIFWSLGGADYILGFFVGTEDGKEKFKMYKVVLNGFSISSSAPVLAKENSTKGLRMDGDG